MWQRSPLSTPPFNKNKISSTKLYHENVLVHTSNAIDTPECLISDYTI